MYFSSKAVLVVTSAVFGTTSAVKCTDYRAHTGLHDYWAMTPSVTSDPDSSLMCTLSEGDRDFAVNALQIHLNTFNVNVGDQDGIFGKNTKAGVEAVQRRAGIKVDGVYGPDTRRIAMKWAAEWKASKCRKWDDL